jgi:hypothetical protein
MPPASYKDFHKNKFSEPNLYRFWFSSFWVIPKKMLFQWPDNQRRFWHRVFSDMTLIKMNIIIFHMNMCHNYSLVVWGRGNWEFNRTREKVSSRRINLEGNTHVQEIMRVNSLYSYLYLNQQKPLFLPIIAYTLASTKLEIRAK